MQCFTALHIQGHLKNTYHLNIDVLGQDSSAQAITSRPRTSVRYVIRNKIWPPDEMVVTAAHSIEKMSYKDFKTVANSENLVTIRRSAVAFHRWSPTTSVFKYKTHPYMRFAVGDKGWSPTPEVAHSSFYCITILIHSDKTLFQNVFVTLLRRVAKDVTSSLLSWHKRYDFNAANVRRHNQ